MATAFKQRQEYDVEKIHDIADPETVCEFLGIDVRTRGNRKEILCPAHDDRHYGSCKLTKTGFHCFACGEHGDVIKLVEVANHCSFPEACEFICNIYSDAMDFKKNSTRPTKRVISDDKLRLIGLAPLRSPIYKTVAMVEEFFPENELEKGQRLEWYPYYIDADAPKNALDEDQAPYEPCGYCVVEQLVDAHPLQSLLNDDEPFYNDLIHRKAVEAKDTYIQMIDMSKNPAKYTDEDDALLVYYCKRTAEVVGMADWLNELSQRVRECDNIRIEFSLNGKTERKTKKSVFGKIKGTGASF